jgi:hypothetical protein
MLCRSTLGAASGDEPVAAKTFAELGIPFSLFEAPSDQAIEYAGVNTCSLCAQSGQHCFLLGIGCYLILDCPNCGTANGLDADDRHDVLCRGCHAAVPFPAIDDDEIRVCYPCLRSGTAAITKDTELGMVSWEQAIEGVTLTAFRGSIAPTSKWSREMAVGSVPACQSRPCSSFCRHRLI